MDGCAAKGVACVSQGFPPEGGAVAEAWPGMSPTSSRAAGSQGTAPGRSCRAGRGLGPRPREAVVGGGRRGDPAGRAGAGVGRETLGPASPLRGWRPHAGACPTWVALGTPGQHPELGGGGHKPRQRWDRGGHLPRCLLFRECPSPGQSPAPHTPPGHLPTASDSSRP